MYTTYILSDTFKIVTDYNEVFLLDVNNLFSDTLKLEHGEWPIQALQIINDSAFSISYLNFVAQVKVNGSKLYIQSVVCQEDNPICKSNISKIYTYKKEHKGKYGIFSVYKNWAFIATDDKIIELDLNTQKEIEICDIDKGFSPFVVQYPIIGYTSDFIYLNIVSQNRCYFVDIQSNVVNYLDLPKKKKNEIWYFVFDLKSKSDYLVFKAKDIYNIYRYNREKNALSYILALNNDLLQIYNDNAVTYSVEKEGTKTVLGTTFVPLKMNFNNQKMNLLPVVEIKQ
jgi:hypothetical protein